MNKAEKSGQRMAALIAAYPQRAKLIAWTVIVPLLAFGCWSIWQSIAAGTWTKLIALVAVGVAAGWRHYSRTKKSVAD